MIHQRADLIVFADVGRNELDDCAELSKLCRERVAFFLVTTRNHHLGTVPSEGLSGGPTYACERSCDKNDPVAHEFCSLRLFRRLSRN